MDRRLRLARARGSARRGQSLLAKYAAHSALLVSCMLVAAGVVGGYFTWNDSAAAQAALLAERARSAALEIESFHAESTRALSWALAAVQPGDGAGAGQRRLEMIRLLRRVPAFTDILWIDARGTASNFVSRVDLDSNGGGSDYSVDPRYREARAHGQHTSPVYFRKGSEPFASIAVAGAAGEVIVAEANLKLVWDIVWRERIGQGGITYVVDPHAQLIVHPDMSQVLRRTDLSQLPYVRAALGGATLPAGSKGVDDFLGQRVLIAAAPARGAGWTVFAQMPEREALAPVYDAAVRTAWLLLAGIAISAVASLVLARRMVRPIHQLGQGAAEIGAGRLDKRIDVRTGDELEALAHEFNRMAEGLEHIYATLESRIAERTGELSRANEAKTRFLAAASHDLRQPVHALSLFVEQLRDTAAATAPQLAPLLQRVGASVAALEQLLDALLDLSRIDGGAVAVRLEAFPLQPVLERLSAHFGSAGQAQGAAVQVMRTSLWAQSDLRLVEQILLNFVANAVRHAARGRVVIGCRRRGREVEVQVVDSGSGIAARDLPFIFDEFFRADARGDGLGLGRSSTGWRSCSAIR
jgi:signal transduction histidine kinase